MNCRKKRKKEKKKIFFFQSMMTKVSYLDNESLFFPKVSENMLHMYKLKVKKFQHDSINHKKVIKKKPKGGVNLPPPPPMHNRVNIQVIVILTPLRTRKVLILTIFFTIIIIILKYKVVKSVMIKFFIIIDVIYYNPRWIGGPVEIAFHSLLFLICSKSFFVLIDWFCLWFSKISLINFVILYFLLGNLFHLLVGLLINLRNRF